jgi:chromosomal replication initiation ATPase DnaA
MRPQGSRRFLSFDGTNPGARRVKRRLAHDPAALALIRTIALRRRIPLCHLLGDKRGILAAAEARQLAMYLLHVLLGRPQDAVGELLGRERSTVSYACHLMEDKRDDPVFEAEIALIEKNFWLRYNPAAMGGGHAA